MDIEREISEFKKNELKEVEESRKKEKKSSTRLLCCMRYSMN